MISVGMAHHAAVTKIKTTKINSGAFFRLLTEYCPPKNYPPYGTLTARVSECHQARISLCLLRWHVCIFSQYSVHGGVLWGAVGFD